MKLETYVRNNYPSVAEAAREYGVTRQYLYSLFRGKNRPRLKLAKLIEDKTKGKVSAAELMGLK
jgi:DNA-binding XRE family transcriptional regulator